MEKERVDTVQELNDSMQERERAYQASKTEATKDLAKVQQELEALHRDRQRSQQVRLLEEPFFLVYLNGSY